MYPAFARGPVLGRVCRSPLEVVLPAGRVATNDGRDGGEKLLHELGGDELVDDLALSPEHLLDRSWATEIIIARAGERSAVELSCRARSAHTCSDRSEVSCPWRTSWIIKSCVRWIVLSVAVACWPSLIERACLGAPGFGGYWICLPFITVLGLGARRSTIQNKSG